MKNFESATIARKAATRLLEVAITEETFKKWSSKQQRDWIKDHPTSKFAKQEKKAEKPSTKKGAPKSKNLRESFATKAKELDENIRRLRRESNLLFKERDNLLEEVIGKPPTYATDAEIREADKKNPRLKKLQDDYLSKDSEADDLESDYATNHRIANYPNAVLTKITGEIKALPPLNSPNGTNLVALVKNPKVVSIELKPTSYGTTSYVINTADVEALKKSKHVISLDRWGEDVRIVKAIERPE